MPVKATKAKKTTKAKTKKATRKPEKKMAKKTAKIKKVTKSSKTKAKKVTKLSKPKKNVVIKSVIKKTTTKKAASKSVKSKAKKVVKKTTPAKKAVKRPMREKILKEKKIKKITKQPKKTTKAKAKVSEAMKSASVTVVSQILGLSDIKPYQPKKKEEYMGEEMQAHFRKILQVWRLQLMEEVDRTVHHMKDDAANFPDPSDRATQEEEFSLELRTRDRERKLIKKIEEALRLLDDGEYGYCESCGVEIGLRRLEARPTANLCIDCKMLDEIREKQQGG